MERRRATKSRRIAREARAAKRRIRRRRYAVVAALIVAGIGVLIALLEDPEPVQMVLRPAAAPPPTLAEFAANPNKPENLEPTLSPAALEAKIGELAAYYGGTYGVAIYDPASGEKVALNTEETFFAASIGKLPTLISLYEAAAAGEVDLNDEITMYASDVQSYGTGVLHNEPVGFTLTLRESAYYLMNKSDNTAWAMLTRYLGIGEIQADMASIGADDTAYWTPNTTTADDVLLMLRKVTDSSFTSPELSEEMLDSMTNTDFEDRISGGLPQDVRVAHKIGSYDSSYSDAGVVFYEGPGGKDRHYFIVVLTAGIGEGTARAAIQEISAATHQTFGVARPGETFPEQRDPR